MKALYRRRLLKCAAIVEKAKNFRMSVYMNECGSPVCVLGHYAKATRFRVFKRGEWFFPDGTEEKAVEHFGIDRYDFFKLFSADGCDRAATGQQAAKYIRKFVADRQ